MIHRYQWILAIGFCLFCFYISTEGSPDFPRDPFLPVNSVVAAPTPPPAPSSKKGSPRPTFNFKYNQFVNVSSVVAMINPPNLYQRLKIPFKWYAKEYDRELRSYGSLQHLDTPIFAGFPETNLKQGKWQKYGWNSKQHK